MIQKTLTGIRITDNNPSIDLPCAINDTFIAKTPISFVVSINMLNSLIGTSINSGNIGNFSLLVRVITATTTDTFVSTVFPLSASNIINGFIVLDISSITDIFTNDYILLHCTEDDIHKLFKKFRIAFRIFQSSNGTGDQKLLLANDIVSDFNMCLNTYETGPYDVEFLQLDLLNPNEFTVTERQQIINSKPTMLGVESIRCFFSSNINKKMPLFVYTHGNKQYTETFDSYLSTLASYGYFCVSVYITPEDLQITGDVYILQIIDHLKQNISKINSGRFNLKIDFNKIIFSGLSLGGLFVENIVTLMKRKNAINSKISNISFDYSDIKALVTIGSVGKFTTGIDGITVREDISAMAGGEGESIVNPDDNNLHYFQYDHDIPTVVIVGLNDNESIMAGYTNSLFNPGFSYTDKLNHLDKYILISNREHNGLSDLTTYPEDEYSFSISPRYVDNHYLNSNRLVLNENLAWVIYFLSINVFSNNKLKKLRYISPHKQNINNIVKNNVKIAAFHSFYPIAEDIAIQIDNFYGLTLSFAGNTGFTLQNPLGFTFDYTLDSSFYQDPTLLAANPNLIVGQTYINNLLEMKTSFCILQNSGYSPTLEEFWDNDTYNGIIFNSYRSLFVPIESNLQLGYTFTNNIVLSENTYIGLRACHTYIHGISGISKNDKFSNFNLTLIDTSGNNSTISSKNYSTGFYPQTKIDNRTNPIFVGAYPTVPNFCFFRAGDFFMKNQSLDITKINQMRLDFGPDYGSTFSHIALDAFVVYKEL
jgi:hypothetical protein